MSICEACELNKKSLGVPHHNPEFHMHELHYDPLEAVYIDVWDSTVHSHFGHNRYYLIAVCLICGMVFNRPIRNLTTVEFIRVITSIAEAIRLEFKVKLKLIICDSATQFKERQKLSTWKLANDIEIQPLDAHRLQPDFGALDAFFLLVS